jgi:hypothetical protein
MSVFCFCLDGTIPVAFSSVPWLAHYSQVVEFGKIHEKLENVYWLTGAKCCIDLAFENIQKEYLYKLSQDVFGSLALTHRERKLEIQKKGRQHWCDERSSR